MLVGFSPSNKMFQNIIRTVNYTVITSTKLYKNSEYQKKKNYKMYFHTYVLPLICILIS